MPESVSSDGALDMQHPTTAISKADFDTPGDALPRPHLHSYWLLPGRLLCGQHPGHQGAAALQGHGFTHVLDLTSAHDRLPPCNVPGATRLSFPIVDYGVPTVEGMRATLQALQAALDAGGTVYLHCMAGIGRTGTVAACLLVEHGYTPAEALALLQRKWRVAAQRAFAAQTPETEAQRAFIARWTPGPAALG